MCAVLVGVDSVVAHGNGVVVVMRAIVGLSVGSADTLQSASDVWLEQGVRFRDSLQTRGGSIRC